MALEPLYGSVTEELYEWMRPLAYADDTYDYPFKRLCATLADPLQVVDDIARGDGESPGYSPVFNIDGIPGAFIKWLAQGVGTPLTKGLSEDAQRQEVRDHVNFRRGTPSRIVAAAQRSLSGAKTVHLQERFGGDAYHFWVSTVDVETPDASVVVADITAAKPIGLTFEHHVFPAGKVWDTAVGRWDDAAATTTQWDQADTSAV